jgi:hypothetical protein
MKINKILLVDLDDTLCDTESFKKFLFKVISEKSGLKIKEVIKIYEKMKKDKPLQEGWVNKLASKISKASGISKNKLINLINESANNVAINKKILNRVRNFDADKFIITLGDKKLQKVKIKSLNIEKYFLGVIYVPLDKEKFIRRRIKNKKLVIKNKRYKEVMILDDKDYLLGGLKKYDWIKIVNPKNI